MEHYRNAFPTSTVHPASTVPPAACSPAFHASVFLLHFFVSSYFNPCNSFCFGFFLVISYTLSTDISLSLYKLNFTSLRQYSEREAVSPLLPPFPIFFHFLSSFSVVKNSSEDDNSEDGWLDLFLLEEEGCWLGCGGNSRFPCF